MPGGSKGTVGTHEITLQGAEWLVRKAERFERTKAENREDFGKIGMWGMAAVMPLIFVEKCLVLWYNQSD